MDMILQVAPDEIREPPAPPAQDQDYEELDTHAEAGDDAVDSGHDPDQDAVHDTDQEFNPSGTLLVRKELFQGFPGCIHADHS